MGFLTGEQKKLFKRRTEKSSMGFLTGGQKKAAWVVRKSGMGFFNRRTEKSFLTGEQKNAEWVF